jgi:hypothetical protein
MGDKIGKANKTSSPLSPQQLMN